jgi:predicted SnoaL-like aldol condensation-catalyzing enzyme
VSVIVLAMSSEAVRNKQLDLRRVIAEDDLVVMHYRMVTPDGERAVVDIWRMVDGQIVEHWDVVQPVPDTSGMF